MEIGPLVKQTVVKVGPDHTLAEAARRMVTRKVGSAVVTAEDGQPGIITERDVLRAVADDADLDHTSVRVYMTPTAITATRSWEVEKAARCMIEGGFRHLIVLDEGGEPEGILSIRDLVEALLSR
jgi:CBS domain-containing protein